jgi:DNA-binding winged helix-turn-helix (wHTH) protein/Tol biopolymer transport system component
VAISQPLSPTIRFGSFQLDVAGTELRKHGTLIKLQPQPLRILLLLTQRAGQVVTREEIQQCVWSNSTFVDFERGINFSINQIRGALADNADRPRYIETLPRRGYRFIAQVAHEDFVKELFPAQVPTVASNSEVSGNGAHAMFAAESCPTALSEQVVATTWTRVRLVRAGVTAAIGLLAFGAVVTYRAVFRVPKMGFENLQITKLTNEGKAVQVAISPDGRYLAYAALGAEESGLRIRHVETRSDVQIPLPDKDRERFLGLTFSPDGNFIYYLQSSKTIASYNYLYRVPVLGGTPILLSKNADTAPSFSPTGQVFVYTQGSGDRNIIQVRIANADGTGDRLLASIPDGASDFQAGPAWSPDGKTIAVPVMLRGEHIRFTVDEVSVANGKVHELYSDSNEMGRPVWLAGGDALVTTIRDQSGRGQLWAISHPSGKPMRLTNDLEDYLDDIDVTRDGKDVVAITRRFASSIWMAPDADALRAKQITSELAGFTRVASMSPAKLFAGTEQGAIWTVNTDGSDPSPFTTVRNAYSPTPCGSSVIFNSLHDGTIDVVRVDADGLKPTTLFHGDIGPPTCSSDGRSIFFVRTIKPYAILCLPSEGGAAVEIVKSPGYEIIHRLSISADGKLLVYAYDEALPATGTTLTVIPVGGGTPLQTFNVPSDLSTLHWSRDGHRLQYLLTRSGVTNIWEQPVAGGEPQQFTKFRSGRIFDFDWSTDGKQLVMTRGDSSSDVVLLSHLR